MCVGTYSQKNSNQLSWAVLILTLRNNLIFFPFCLFPIKMLIGCSYNIEKLRRGPFFNGKPHCIPLTPDGTRNVWNSNVLIHAFDVVWHLSTTGQHNKRKVANTKFYPTSENQDIRPSIIFILTLETQQPVLAFTERIEEFTLHKVPVHHSADTEANTTTVSGISSCLPPEAHRLSTRHLSVASFPWSSAICFNWAPLLRWLRPLTHVHKCDGHCARLFLCLWASATLH